MTMPTLFTPFVRFQLLAWSPLSDMGRVAGGGGAAGGGGGHHQRVQDMEWYLDLFDFGMGGGGGGEEVMDGGGADDVDEVLVPTLVEKVLPPPPPPPPPPPCLPALTVCPQLFALN